MIKNMKNKRSEVLHREQLKVLTGGGWGAGESFLKRVKLMLNCS